MLHLSQAVISSGMCPNLGTSAVIMMQATHNGEREDLAICVVWWHRPGLRLWNLLSDPLMWSGSVEIVHICAQHPLKLLLLQDEQGIETLAPHTPHKALADGIRSRSVIGCCEHLDATRLGNPREVHPKLAIVITDEVFGPLSKCRGFPQRYVQSKRRWDIV
jgi:hypothetical protein